MTKYFVYCPDCGFDTFDNLEERDKAAQICVEHHLDEVWDEDVTGVCSGVVEQQAQECRREERPDNIDVEGIAEDGGFWLPEWTHKCDYQMSPLPPANKD